MTVAHLYDVNVKWNSTSVMSVTSSTVEHSIVDVSIFLKNFLFIGTNCEPQLVFVMQWTHFYSCSTVKNLLM